MRYVQGHDWHYRRDCCHLIHLTTWATFDQRSSTDMALFEKTLDRKRSKPARAYTRDEMTSNLSEKECPNCGFSAVAESYGYFRSEDGMTHYGSHYVEYPVCCLCGYDFEEGKIHEDD